MNKKKKFAIIGIICALGVGIGTYLFYHQPKKAYDYSDFYVEQEVQEKEDITSEEVEPEPTIQVLSLDLLKQRNKDVVGILEFDERMIYEPIVQAPDNEYYVRKNIDRKYASGGIPFISGDANINSTNVIIYGHSSTQSSIIFTPLMSYKDKKFYLAHPTFKFILEDKELNYEIFSVLNIDLNNLDDTLEFTKSSFRSIEDYGAFISEMARNSIYNTGVSVSTNDKLMTLVTCDTANGNKRVVVLAKKI